MINWTDFSRHLSLNVRSNRCNIAEEFNLITTEKCVAKIKTDFYKKTDIKHYDEVLDWHYKKFSIQKFGLIVLRTFTVKHMMSCRKGHR